MVERLSPINTAFFDLDGTLIDGNSMKIFMGWLPIRLLKSGKILSAISSLLWLSLRAARLISHPRMKWELTRIARRRLHPKDWAEIAERIAMSANSDVERFLRLRKKAGDRLCLATAAPEEYAVIIARHRGMDYVTATTFTPDFTDFIENKGVRKLAGIRNLMQRENLAVTFFLTDHHDDLPSIEAFAEKTYLVNPSRKTRDLCGPSIKTFDINDIQS